MTTSECKPLPFIQSAGCLMRVLKRITMGGVAKELELKEKDVFDEKMKSGLGKDKIRQG